MNELTTTTNQQDAARTLARSFLSGKSEKTIRAYASDLQDFAAFVGMTATEDALLLLLSLNGGSANELVLRYKDDMMKSDLAAATINRRLAAIRSAIKLARTLGMVSWSIEISGMKSKPYRDTRGPGLKGVAKMLELANSARDTAIVRCLFDLGMRRGEVCGLDLEDVDLSTRTVSVVGKGHTEQERLTLPDATAEAIRQWVEVRGNDPGPLFKNYDRAKKGNGRLTEKGLYGIIVKLGLRADMKVRPHGLRHAAITQVLEISRGDLRAAAKFSRHRDVRTLCIYDDNREDVAGDLARQLSGFVSSKTHYQHQPSPSPEPYVG